MTSSRREAARSATSPAAPGTRSVTERHSAFPAGPANGWSAPPPGKLVNPLDAFAVDGEQAAASEPLTEHDAEIQVHGICFKTGPPRRMGVELEWLVYDGRDPASPVDQQRVTAALAGLGSPGALPGCGRLTTEPG